MGLKREEARATNPWSTCCRRMTSRLVLWIALVLALAGALPGTARADWDDRPDPSEYEESLNPHGYWVDDNQYGRVWRPYTSWDWRPYVDGQWV